MAHQHIKGHLVPCNKMTFYMLMCR